MGLLLNRRGLAGIGGVVALFFAFSPQSQAGEQYSKWHSSFEAYSNFLIKRCSNASGTIWAKVGKKGKASIPCQNELENLLRDAQDVGKQIHCDEEGSGECLHDEGVETKIEKSVETVQRELSSRPLSCLVDRAGCTERKLLEAQMSKIDTLLLQSKAQKKIYYPNSASYEKAMSTFTELAQNYDQAKEGISCSPPSIKDFGQFCEKEDPAFLTTALSEKEDREASDFSKKLLGIRLDEEVEITAVRENYIFLKARDGSCWAKADHIPKLRALIGEMTGYFSRGIIQMRSLLYQELPTDINSVAIKNDTLYKQCIGTTFLRCMEKLDWFTKEEAQEIFKATDQVLDAFTKIDQELAVFQENHPGDFHGLFKLALNKIEQVTPALNHLQDIRPFFEKKTNMLDFTSQSAHDLLVAYQNTTLRTQSMTKKGASQPGTFADAMNFGFNRVYNQALQLVDNYTGRLFPGEFAVNAPKSLNNGHRLYSVVRTLNRPRVPAAAKHEVFGLDPAAYGLNLDLIATQEIQRTEEDQGDVLITPTLKRKAKSGLLDRRKNLQRLYQNILNEKDYSQKLKILEEIRLILCNGVMSTLKNKMREFNPK